MDVSSILNALDTNRFGQSMRFHERVESTNTDAATWAQDGAPEGAVVATDYQTAGRGRHGRSWDADPGQNVMLSVVLRPNLDADQLGRVIIAAGIAVAETVEAFVEPHPVSIKWPNDIMIDGRKTCGMLLEASFGRASEGPPSAVILGIGLNVNQTDFPPALSERATSMRLAVGRTLPREAVLVRLLERLEEWYDVAIDGRPVHEAYEKRLDRMGEHVDLRFAGTDRTVSGTVRGVTASGALRLDTDSGEQVLHAGEVTSRSLTSEA
ncbi:biotin--[acetyl-CoA-carboxylase] ligase [Longibacter salinarum]|uniref:biotin--[biotin carboxyl-carrier protein] ligase n=1 Tax=Longibacter salinarum TaxID=1850348 RepID=A0A2A8CTS4_9BACT|nr:biotin--[acetyl-CoA-carboxylase] ligase [Longibacter salinarum]PEN11102.1 biotin--[acetyl-CoA-carboxylase] ligase [Longibacter salinarum]